MRVSGENLKTTFGFHECHNIVTQYGAATPRQCRRCSRFTGTWWTDECNRSIPNHHGTRMQARCSAEPERQSQDRAEEVSCRILDRRVIRPASPNIIPVTINPELHSVKIYKMKDRAARIPPNPQRRVAAGCKPWSRVVEFAAL